MSTTEAEYISAASAIKEITWLKKLLIDCKIKFDKYILFVDYTSAIKLIKNPEFHQRSEHIDATYHFVRNNHREGEIDVTYAKTDEKIADIFTEALPKPKFLYTQSKLGLKRKNKLSNELN